MDTILLLRICTLLFGQTFASLEIAHPFYLLMKSWQVLTLEQKLIHDLRKWWLQGKRWAYFLKLEMNINVILFSNYFFLLAKYFTNISNVLQSYPQILVRKMSPCNMWNGYVYVITDSETRMLIGFVVRMLITFEWANFLFINVNWWFYS